jgi:hypothetical protein
MKGQWDWWGVTGLVIVGGIAVLTAWGVHVVVRCLWRAFI